MIAVIGAGPAGLMAAETIAASGTRVTVYDAMPSPGRKFLMAGRGGLNLTHSEPFEQFVSRYGNALPHLHAALDATTPEMLRGWASLLGEPTFVGSSGRVFPKSFKASPLLRAWLRRLTASGVEFKLRHRWQGWDDERRLIFATAAGRHMSKADAVVLALGGASWPRLGSDGAWTDVLAAGGVTIAPLKPANCGFAIAWSDVFRDRFAGVPLKTVALAFGASVSRGDLMITRDGIEGGAVYALSAHLRDTIAREGSAVLDIALRPDISQATLTQKLSAPRGKQSFATFLRKALGLSPPAVALIQESAIQNGRPVNQLAASELAALIHALPLRLTATAPIARAISTAGGVSFDEIDPHFMLKRMPGVFVAGEMLDWEAPTGGYLLQACFATGAAAGRGVIEWRRHPRERGDPVRIDIRDPP